MIPFYLPYHLAFAAKKLNFADNYSYAKKPIPSEKGTDICQRIFLLFSKFYTVHSTLQPPKW